MYAIEAGQPDVSRAKLDGLAEHYGVANDSEPGAAYFALHAERDHEHAAGRDAPRGGRGRTNADRLVEVAESGAAERWTCWTESTPGGNP